MEMDGHRLGRQAARELSTERLYTIDNGDLVDGPGVEGKRPVSTRFRGYDVAGYGCVLRWSNGDDDADTRSRVVRYACAHGHGMSGRAGEERGNRHARRPRAGTMLAIGDCTGLAHPNL